MASKEEFSTLMQRLEQLVTALESGSLSLEEAVQTFEQGVKVAAEGKHRLQQAEKRVSILLNSAEGEQLSAFVKKEDQVLE